MIEQIFSKILIMSLTGSMLTALLLSLRKLTSKFFTGKWHYYTYAVAILVFLIPLSVKLPEKEVINEEARVKETQVIYIPIEESVSQNESTQITAKQVQKTSFKDGLWEIYRQISVFLPYVWLGGFCIYFTFSVLSYALFVRRLKRNAVYLDEKTDFGIHSMRIAKSSLVSSPVLVGILSPTLYLPEREISDEDFHNILCHEAVHLKRHDLEIKRLCLLARSVHWFNPFIHMLSSIISKECEISCDLEATKGMDRTEITSYCETILSLVTVKDETASMTTLGMGSTKKTLERRFGSIMENKKTGKTIIIISAISACIIILGAFTVSALLGGNAEADNSSDAELVADMTDKEPKLVADYTVENASEDEADISKAIEEEPIIKYQSVEDKTEYKLIVNDENTSGAAQISAHYDEEKHPAVDYRLEADTVITSPIDGTILTAEFNAEKGNHILIEGIDGTSTILFAHLAKMYVSAGDKVNAGDNIGTVGSTGMSTGPHLHVEYTENGEAANPVSLIFVEKDGSISAVYSYPEQIID